MIKERTCIACRTKGQKEQFIRIIADNGDAKIDETKKSSTRGMYICNNSTCINKLLKAKDITKCIKINASTECVKELLRNLGE